MMQSFDSPLDREMPLSAGLRKDDSQVVGFERSKRSCSMQESVQT